MDRRLRVLSLLVVVNAALAVGAIGVIAWMTADPVFWFPKLASEQGPRGTIGQTGSRGPQGAPGPAGVTGDDALASRVADLERRADDLETVVGSNSSGNDYGTRLDDLEGVVGTNSSINDFGTRLDSLESDVSDAQSTISDVCGALDGANDVFLNGTC